MALDVDVVFYISPKQKTLDIFGQVFYTKNLYNMALLDLLLFRGSRNNGNFLGSFRLDPDNRITLYSSYQAQVEALSTRYSTAGLRGSKIIKALTDYRVDLISGAGLNVEDLPEELETKFDNISDLITLGELEGQVLLNIYKDGDGWHFDPIRFVSNPYFIGTEDQLKDKAVAKPYGEVYVNDKKKLKIGFKDPENVGFDYENALLYICNISGFRNLQMIEQPSPDLAYILYESEALDRIQEEVRAVNYKASKPTPVVNCPDVETQQLMYQQMTGNVDRDEITSTKGKRADQWTIGDCLFVINGSFEMVSVDSSVINAYEAEFKMNVRSIASALSIPVFALGFPDLFGSKAGFEEVSETLEASVDKERQNWTSAFKDILKIITGKSLEVNLPFVSPSKLKSLNDIFLPLHMADIVSKDFIAERIGGIDMDQEKQRMKGGRRK